MAVTTGEPGRVEGRDPLRHHRRYVQSKHGASPYAGGSSFMERVSEAKMNTLTEEVHAATCRGASAK